MNWAGLRKQAAFAWSPTCSGWPFHIDRTSPFVILTSIQSGRAEYDDSYRTVVTQRGAASALEAAGHYLVGCLLRRRCLRGDHIQFHQLHFRFPGDLRKLSCDGTALRHLVPQCPSGTCDLCRLPCSAGQYIPPLLRQGQGRLAACGYLHAAS